MSNIIDKIQLSGVTYDIGGQGGSGVSVVEVTQAEYDALPSSAKTDTSKMYVITDAQAGDLTNYYTKTETNTLLGGKQATLVSGTNIKTVNNESLLGSGNIDIQGGGKAIEAGRGITVTTGATADTVSFNLPISAGTANMGNITCCGSNTVSGEYAVAFGNGNTTSGGASLTFGRDCSANSYDNVAGGFGVTTRGIQASSFGQYTKTENVAEHSVGRYNASNKANTTWGDSGNTLFSVGNGTADNARHNAFEIRQNGDIYLTSGGTDIKLQDHLGGGGSSYTAGNGIDITNDVISVTGKVDTTTYNTYTAATDTALATKQTTLTAGTNITIVDNVISATGGGGGGTVESAITSGSTNAVESKAIWSATTYNKEVTLQWDNGFPSKLSTNYPSGCKKFVVTVPSNNTATITLYNGGSPIGGSINISNWSSLSVSIDGYDGTTYTIDGNDVTFVVPDTITFDQLQTDTRKITSIKAIVEGAWIADNTYMKSEVDAIQNTLQNNINQKLDSTAYTPVTIDSTLIENSTNPVEGGALYDELVYKGAASETTIEWSGNESTNYPSGCAKIKVEVSGSNNGMSISFYDDNWQKFGTANINNWGGISVYFNDLQGATYEISGPIVTISYPSVTGVTILRSSGMVTYTTKAVTYGASTTVKDALGGLKFVKLTQTEYDNLQTKDSNTLYVIVN